MHTRSFRPESSFSVSTSCRPLAASTAPAPAPSSTLDELTRLFSTAVISTQGKQKRNFSAELRELTESATFRTILNAVRQHARIQGLSEKQAAEQVIETFRKIDEIWGEYLIQEGIDRLRKGR